MLKYLRLILTAGWRILWDFLFYINRYARHPERYPLELRYKRVRDLIVFIEKSYRIDVQTQGLEGIRGLEREKRAFLVVADHLSYFDPLGMTALCERPISFVAKKETIKMPFIGTAVKAIDGVFLDREDLRQSLEAMKTVEKRLASGYCSYVIFPEGTRNRHPENGVAAFHPGSFKPAVVAGTPIVVCGLYGTTRVFPKKPDYKRTPVEYYFYPPIEGKGLRTTEFAPKAYEMVVAKFEEGKAEDKRFFEKGFDKVPLRKGKVR
ncbi:MAG: 1-acyl-sn-glycerol-3-phosphate acyltransferase [Bacilli bacterium]|jgi:1-acyl-sn-glycerol-3-phosphate acyltransferase|nr:1-acyl-sn-glycerol-3-phosphate acyltransferase [Bacilli bacterium]